LKAFVAPPALLPKKFDWYASVACYQLVVQRNLNNYTYCHYQLDNQRNLICICCAITNLEPKEIWVKSICCVYTSNTKEIWTTSICCLLPASCPKKFELSAFVAWNQRYHLRGALVAL
jgi:hypothetical protein